MYFTCQECGESFECPWQFGDAVTCPACGAVNETDWDYVDEEDGIAAWTTRIVAEPQQ